jgi:FlaA1/EpsC-like NDP-sugar epimerase
MRPYHPPTVAPYDAFLADRIQGVSGASRRVQWRLLRVALVVLDIAILSLAFALAFWLRFNLDFPVLRTEVLGDAAFYGQVAFAVIPLWLVIFAVVGLYREQMLLGGTREYALVFNAVSVGVVVIVVVTFLSQELAIARAWLVMAWALSFLFVASGRFVLRRGVYWLRTRGWFLESTLIVGTNEEALSLAEQLGHWRRARTYRSSWPWTTSSRTTPG